VFFSGFFVKSKKYHPLDYLSIFLIVSGIYLYNFFKNKTGGEDSAFGMFILALSLFCDGINGYFSEILRERFNPTNFRLMKNCNLIGTAILLAICAFCLLTGVYEKNYAAYFIENPYMFKQVLLYGALSSVGQIFVFRTVKSFGPLSLAIITTTRKLAKFFLSLFIFQHAISF
jgi:UDP-galactose transporter B1